MIHHQKYFTISKFIQKSCYPDNKSVCLMEFTSQTHEYVSPSSLSFFLSFFLYLCISFSQSAGDLLIKDTQYSLCHSSENFVLGTNNRQLFHFSIAPLSRLFFFFFCPAVASQLRFEIRVRASLAMKIRVRSLRFGL